MSTKGNNNVVSGVLEDEKLKRLEDHIAQMRAELDMLATLSRDQKRGLMRPDMALVDACREIAKIATDNPDEFPKSLCDGEEMIRDRELHDRLLGLQEKLTSLNSDIEDTLTALRSDIVRQGLLGYNLIQRLGTSRPELLKAIDPIASIFGKRFGKR
jgi:hypothetical protein